MEFFQQPIITDAAPAILAAVTQHHPSFKQMNCYLHVKRRLDPKFKHLENDLQVSIKNDLATLQLSFTQHSFINSTRAFTAKCSEFNMELFIDYFTSNTWIKNRHALKVLI